MNISLRNIRSAWHMLAHDPSLDWEAAAKKWSKAAAWSWYRSLPWLAGCNYIPAYAGNQLEMWGRDTFNAGAIDKELALMASGGMNTVRVFLHDLLYEHEQDSFYRNMDHFLAICAKHGILVMFVFFDDCWTADPVYGKKYVPRKGVHNAIWLQSPGYRNVVSRERWPLLEKYVSETIGRNRNNATVFCWDLYNEPGGSGLGKRSAALLEAAFSWARASGTSQPLTSGIHAISSVADIAAAHSDIITFHHYGKLQELDKLVTSLAASGRPLICTEYLARNMGSVFRTHLPYFKEKQIGALHWGFVAGRSQTIYPWHTLLFRAGKEPDVWFHDLYHPDHSPFDAEEIALFKRMTGM
jgi:hypothetical protein